MDGSYKVEQTGWIGDLPVVFKGERYPGDKVVEGSVYADGNFICAILEEDFKSFIYDLNSIVNKHRI